MGGFVLGNILNKQAVRPREPWAEAPAGSSEQLLGFGLMPAAGTVLESNERRILRQCGNEKIYELNFPILSVPEARLVSEILREFRARQEPKARTETVLLEETFRQFMEVHAIRLEKDQKQYLLKFLQLSAFRYGLLSFLLDDEELEEIALIGTGIQKPVRVFHPEHGWMSTNLYYAGLEEVVHAINRLSMGCGRRISLQHPSLNAVLENGNRLHACIPPAAFQEPNFTIRKFRSNPFTPFELVQRNTVGARFMAF
ncbi:MAG: hypothetical protein HY917_04480, partial [Candidatus Diapherotrites archaeon]|nr:hypothetical protein [Candidatus Diapherotrites archaeon]